ncbi:MAG: Omp28 family outer membrane lipoprotein [Porphyromonas sp.]|nr:Omp28 family outer membrane lipoprotein [Porphyromonas sp.]
MKKNIIIKIATAIALPALLAVSCKQIPVEDRLIKVEDTYSRTVLIEDFTGVKCVNCPQAAKVVHSTAEQLKGHAIPVSIHGHVSFTPEQHPLFSKDGEEYCRFFGVYDKGSLPSGVFSRKELVGLDGKYCSTTYTTWNAFAAQVAKMPQLYKMELSASAKGRSISVKVKATATEAQKSNPKLKMQLWLLENGLIYPQDDKDLGKIKDYKHEHVLRQALNGTWGTDYSVAQEYAAEFAVANETVVLTNCQVVAFVYDSETYEVYEAIVTDLK